FPKDPKNALSPAAAKIRDPTYSTAPIRTPSHVSSRNPTQGTTSSATAAYSGCLTKAYGPSVISRPRGTFLRMRITDQIQIMTPGTSTAADRTRSPVGGPPTSNQLGCE